MSVVETRDVPARRRYEVSVDDEPAGYLSYDALGAHRILTHAVVDPSHGGRGVGGALVREALDDARARSLTVTPQCPFVEHFIRTHPEYLDLVADPPDRPGPGSWLGSPP